VAGCFPCTTLYQIFLESAVFSEGGWVPGNFTLEKFQLIDFIRLLKLLFGENGQKSKMAKVWIH
jgi:hypothetical protein